jgi:hypothetical protein
VLLGRVPLPILAKNEEQKLDARETTSSSSSTQEKAKLLYKHYGTRKERHTPKQERGKQNMPHASPICI